VGRRREARPDLAVYQRLQKERGDRLRLGLEAANLRREAAQHSLAGRHRQAVQKWMEVIALEPRVAQNYLDLAEALVKSGELEESLGYFVKAAELDGVAEVHLRISKVLAALGRTEESALARQTYQQLQLADFARRAGR
jgi:tetratricopeptide (TPR) repeat protein